MLSKSSIPKYEKIMRYMKEKISNGEWPIGSKIPSQRQLAKEFNVNRSTVITALEELIADGLLEAQMGVGTIVTNNTWNLLSSSLNWNTHVEAGMLKQSRSTVQEINNSESQQQFIQLSKGELSSDMFPLQKMKEIINKVSNHITPFGYEEPKGYLPLRKAVSAYLHKMNVNVSPSSILIVSGALQALQLVSIGLLHKGSTVLLEKPSYLYSLRIFQSAGINLTGIPLDQEGLLVQHLEHVKKKRKEAVLYTNPCFHNPTGTLMSEKRRKNIIETCTKHQIPIIEDDIYRELWFEEAPPLPLKSLDQTGHVLYVGSLSKTLTPGLRIGWIAAPEPVINRLADIKMQIDYGSSSLSQRVAAEWLQSGLYEEHVKKVRENLLERKNVALKLIKQHLEGLAIWEKPQGGFFVWIHILAPISMKSLYARARTQGILLNPGHIYHEQSSRYIRLSYAYASMQDLEVGIKKLGLLIRSLS
ncbi:MocR-like pyridoxine biosynthesis transcription factor PdxR [Priestia endophytica]|jgi:GntR family transcriptional regulator, regulator for abcA and norABC|uniref:GntR family transcriptional regulator, regulator for abcA and norABC n=1 Tax=Priestia endophytica DSM 13796 TaxID=1121089 RepID=A0A1I6BF91_9BACI|nr:PLP-dependent aminotransferase family protein [Priestia endophytica]KAB2495243.1 PLP-dependent aminotransferase family protein [Priestia endophytica]KYG26283.1 GntR family transcriptional regulator [Priestia endophytica]MBG9813906.1 GntR family transcriptional regulator [Priestia endophytica]RAS81009.1 GntR family transcriptional regulator [Priestia endophytica]SFQ79559.1 GntR family transcriptional regulator, regulator for abcA and norABC [Priestia endophytica DSM 13796]